MAWRNSAQSPPYRGSVAVRELGSVRGRGPDSRPETAWPVRTSSDDKRARVRTFNATGSVRWPFVDSYEIGSDVSTF